MAAGGEGAAYWWVEEEEIVGWSEQRVGRPMPYTVASLESIWADPALSLPPPPFPPPGELDALLLAPLMHEEGDVRAAAVASLHQVWKCGCVGWMGGGGR